MLALSLLHKVLMDVLHFVLSLSINSISLISFQGESFSPSPKQPGTVSMQFPLFTLVGFPVCHDCLTATALSQKAQISTCRQDAVKTRDGVHVRTRLGIFNTRKSFEHTSTAQESGQYSNVMLNLSQVMSIIRVISEFSKKIHQLHTQVLSLKNSNQML